MDLLAASKTLWAAGIGVVGAVLGTLVGGLLTYRIERSRDKSRRKRERKAERRMARGIARVWSKKLGDFYVVVDDHSPPREGSAWWKDENDVDAEMDVEDMKRVAAVAKAEQWNEIDKALSHVREARAARQEQRDLSKEDIDRLRRAMMQVELAIKSLASLSGDVYPPEWLDKRIKRASDQDGWRNTTR
jgi:hypothetical protein